MYSTWACNNPNIMLESARSLMLSSRFRDLRERSFFHSMWTSHFLRLSKLEHPSHYLGIVARFLRLLLWSACGYLRVQLVKSFCMEGIVLLQRDCHIAWCLGQVPIFDREIDSLVKFFIGSQDQIVVLSSHLCHIYVHELLLGFFFFLFLYLLFFVSFLT